MATFKNLLVIINLNIILLIRHILFNILLTLDTSLSIPRQQDLSDQACHQFMGCIRQMVITAHCHGVQGHVQVVDKTRMDVAALVLPTA